MWIGLLLLVVTITSKAEAQTKENIIETMFGEIRATIAKDVCSAFGYKNPEVLSKIEYKQLLTFYYALQQDTANEKSKILSKILSNPPSIPINGDVDKCVDSVNNYLLKVKKGCTDKDTSWVSKVRESIHQLSKECKLYIDCESKNNLEKYKKQYPNGLFINVVESKDTLTGVTPIIDNDNQSVEYSSNSSKKDSRKILICIILLCILIIGVLIYLYYYKKKKLGLKVIIYNNNSSDVNTENVKDSTLTTSKDKGEHGVNNKVLRSTSNINNDKKNTVQPIQQENNSTPKGPKDIDIKHQKVEDYDVVTSNIPNVETTQISNVNKNKKVDWILVGASVKGNGHIQSNMPCQDSNKFESLGDGWGIAVVSDGAGSAAHSHVGSKVVTERCLFHFKELIKNEGWKDKNILPSDTDWLLKSYNVLKTIRNEVVIVANKNKVDPKTLSATCLVVIYSPIGLLSAHVGDGRMGYKTTSDEWKSMMTPHKGEEANQTIFIVSDFWSIPHFMLSGVLVPESIVVREPVKAFALMSDGCENTAWKCTTYNPETGKYFDMNEPFDGFFNPLEETMESFYVNKIPEDKQQEKWYRFIESGTKGFIKEQDDKTMIYGVNISLLNNHDS